ncbi:MULTISPECIES: GNAT family N-acetyltransferase [unclassified Pseudoalteromonas]|uniref:GNAT family N-acetyltransferase n=1 Tax=unclassified Pseudoalteromonas TaxID=194690 RepID=UPI001109111A|nr:MULTISPECIES: GNAT family N-acetyltransferase [unclassified Pseudoalteromonas]TMN73628.1 GNAT family N-acetyltransferase [Pseudoalteromonas sp. S1727]BDF94948.1 GNAT family N-acetyltransferase [Pseudoalteromonas sp. KAN5]
MQLVAKVFSELNTPELFAIMRTRVDVFVVEQQCPYPELDDVDCMATTQHLYWIASQQLGAYARCYNKNEQYSAIGRVLIEKSQRGQGFAALLVKEAIQCCFTHWPSKDIYIGAQTYLLSFYQSLGFQSTGEPYLEDGIEHQDMILKNRSV